VIKLQVRLGNGFKEGMVASSTRQKKSRHKASEGKAALVLGGGVAGIQAALDLADGGYQVHLVERTPTLGGRMAQLDKTFPTFDCSI
jgi:heterodisulfide reductase subunit A-like polyferredoxin